MKGSCFAVVFLTILIPASRASAELVDTVSGLTPGDQIGCNYTFQNGDPSIPCATDTVGADGTVSFVKPDAPYDAIEYFDITTDEDIIEFNDVPFSPLQSELTPGTQYPIFQIHSFFDIFVELDVPAFDADDLEVIGTFNLDDAYFYNDGTSPDFPGITLPNGYTGEATIVGFDTISETPEPSTLLLFAIGLGASGCAALRNAANSRVRRCGAVKAGR
jgi:hypothetical protein